MPPRSRRARRPFPSVAEKPGVSDVAARKRLLRSAAHEARAAARAGYPDAAAQVARHVHAMAAAHPGAAGVASGYFPVRSELDPRPAMTALAGLGWSLALPVVIAPGRPLAFRRWEIGHPTVPAGFGLEVPAETTEVVPDLLLVPMLAFDDRGHRLGYGGGYYDRTLAALRAADPRVRAIGVAYSAQRVPLLPDSETDMRLDAIVTETGSVEFA
jgi:5-formyltetrahydrofolate cyclo-ligase